ncbi:hypothetical protein Tco_1196374 [Tanacetum coccineum]
MCTYLKNMEGKKLKDLKNKSFDSIQKMFDKAFKRVNTFVDFRTDLVKGSSKRAGEELEQESTKKQKVDEDKNTAELQSLMKVISDKEEVTIDVVPLATKPLTISMLNKKLQVDYFNEMAYQLLKLLTKQLNEVFRSILLVIMELLMDKLDDFGDKYQVYGRLFIRLKTFLNAVLGVNAASEEVSIAELVS